MRATKNEAVHKMNNILKVMPHVQSNEGQGGYTMGKAAA
jgi:hypothetical protein